MRVALIHPTGSNWLPGEEDITATANRMAPLGLLSIAAWLKRSGHHVTVYDGLGPGVPKGNDALAARVLAGRPDMAGFSTTTSSFLDGVNLAQRLKDKNPDIRTVFGGVHVSAIGAPLLAAYPAIDYLCIGEGEVTMAKLADGGEPSAIDGLAEKIHSAPLAAPGESSAPGRSPAVFLVGPTCVCQGNCPLP